MIEKVISGGQIGADVGALRAAKKAGIATGGWMPKGFRTNDGPRPGYARMYGIVETDGDNYPKRTYLNVRDADATFRLAYNFTSPGERLTLRYVRELDRPHLDIPIERARIWRSPRWAAEWLIKHNVKTLNVAGNADQFIESIVENYLYRVLTFVPEPAIMVASVIPGSSDSKEID